MVRLEQPSIASGPNINDRCRDHQRTQIPATRKGIGSDVGDVGRQLHIYQIGAIGKSIVSEAAARQHHRLRQTGAVGESFVTDRGNRAGNDNVGQIIITIESVGAEAGQPIGEADTAQEPVAGEASRADVRDAAGYRQAGAGNTIKSEVTNVLDAVKNG